MISEKLLSEVLKNEIENRDITYIEICKNVVIYKVSIYDREEEINIHELAYKCKEWAYKQKIGKTGTYYNGCGRSQQHLMYDINIVTKQCDKEYLATIDNGKDLNCSLDFYGISAMHNSSVVQFNYKANTVKDIRFYANTEPEVIFKACQWLLENIK